MNHKGVFFVSDEVARFARINSTRMVEVIPHDEPVVLVYRPTYDPKRAVGTYVLEHTFEGPEIPDIFVPLVELFLGRVVEETNAKLLNPSGVIQTPEWMLTLDELYVERHCPNVVFRVAAFHEGRAKKATFETLQSALQRASTPIPEGGWLAPMSMYSRLPGEYPCHPFLGTPPAEGDLWYSEGNKLVPYAVRTNPKEVRIDMSGFTGMSVVDNPGWRHLQEACLLPKLKSRFALRDHHLQKVQEVLEDVDRSEQLICELVERIPSYYRRFMRRGDLEMALRFPGEAMSITDAPTLQICSMGAKLDTPALTVNTAQAVKRGNQYASLG